MTRIKSTPVFVDDRGVRGISTMHHTYVRSFILLIMTLTFVARANEAGPVQPAGIAGNLILWYRQPGETWLDGLPLGKGLMAAMVFGRVQQERIALNESSFWSGRPHDYDNPEANKFFAQIRDLVFAGKFQEAEEVANAHFCGIPAAQQAGRDRYPSQIGRSLP